MQSGTKSLSEIGIIIMSLGIITMGLGIIIMGLGIIIMWSTSCIKHGITAHVE